MHTNRNRSSARRQSGFSLIELMVVITIIGILGAIVGANVFSAVEDAKIEATKTQMTNIEKAIRMYRLRKNTLPESLEDLIPDYLDTEGDVPVDEWGEAFIYEKQSSREFTLMSLGADKTEGGEGPDADIDRAALRKRSGDDAEE